jgi:hypothetical protein
MQSLPELNTLVERLTATLPDLGLDDDQQEEYSTMRAGGIWIRTPGTLSGTTVFKTAGFNRSPIPPRVGWQTS